MIAGPWVDQLVSSGQLVVPIVNARGLGSILVFDKIDGELEERAETRCRFLRTWNTKYY
jgi:protein-L-isoaspartate O-methyltransferase